MTGPSKPDKPSPDSIIAEARRKRAEREQEYRERALKLYPHLCARCGREFEGRKLRELTVHHKDHNHDNNPADGGNWELLCIYCHDQEHQEYLDQEAFGNAKPGLDRDDPAVHRPFANLDKLFKDKKT